MTVFWQTSSLDPCYHPIHPPPTSEWSSSNEISTWQLPAKISQWFSIIPYKDRIFNIVCKALDELSPPLSPVSPSCSAPVPDPQRPHRRPTTGRAARWVCDTPLGFHHTIPLATLCFLKQIHQLSITHLSTSPPPHTHTALPLWSPLWSLCLSSQHQQPMLISRSHSSRVLIHSSRTHPGVASAQALPRCVPASWVKGASDNILPTLQTWRDMKGHHLVTWKPEESVQMSLISKRNGGFALCHSQRRLKGVVLTLNSKFCFSPPD